MPLQLPLKKLKSVKAPAAEMLKSRTFNFAKLGWSLLLIPAVFLLAHAISSFSAKSNKPLPVNVGGMQLLSIPAVAVTPVQQEMKRVAVCFFGLSRSLTITLPSIRKNLIAPITKAGYEVDVFVHTYGDVDHLTNPRTGEDVDLDTDQWKLLEPFDAILTSQEDYLNSIRTKMKKCLRVGTGWPLEPREMQAANVRNLLAQLNSIYEVGRLWEAHYADRRYSAVIFARPDVQFTCPFPTQLLRNIEEDTLYAPSFAEWEGINDRFALLAPAAATVWKRRRFFNLHECLRAPIHAEIFASAFVNATGLRYRPIERFGFVRIRSTGEVAELDKEFPELCRG